jgi:hypothetical protein
MDNSSDTCPIRSRPRGFYFFERFNVFEVGLTVLFSEMVGTSLGTFVSRPASLNRRPSPVSVGLLRRRCCIGCFDREVPAHEINFARGVESAGLPPMPWRRSWVLWRGRASGRQAAVGTR